MEENKEKNKAILHKDKSLKRLDMSFLTHIELEEFKKSNLLAYWIQDFAVYHDEERYFDCSKSGMFSRGDIIKANLGFNIGNELGGLHYCVVINKYDNLKSGVLNVIPLTSKKENKKYPLSAVNLGKELYKTLKRNLEKETKKLKYIEEKINIIEDIPPKVQHTLNEEKIYIQKIGEEISEMKEDSIALINQITTISKQRIFKNPVLKKVKLSSESLDLLDNKILNYYTNF